MSDERTSLQRREGNALLPEGRASRAPAWRDEHWQRLWLATQVLPWRSLAIVPATKDVEPGLAFAIAERLARTGMTHLGTPIRAVDATRVGLGELVAFKGELEHVMGFGDLVILAVAAPTESAIAVPLAQVADAALLCVLLQMDAKEAERTVEQVGRARFLGTMLANLV